MKCLSPKPLVCLSRVKIPSKRRGSKIYPGLNLSLSQKSSMIIKEDLEVEKEMSSIANKSSIEEPRSSQIVKKAIMKEKKKDKDSFDLDSLQKVIKTIANEMVDVKGKLLKCPIDHLYLSSRRMCKYLLVVRFLLLKVRRLMRMKKKMMNMKYEIQIFSGL